MTTTTAATPHATAHEYAAHGWRVVPIIPGGKHPPLPAWQDNATRDPGTIDAWYTGPYRGHGVGIVTGPGSGLWVLDVDTGDGYNGAESYENLVAAHGPLPDTVTAVTGSGGFHYLWAWPDDGTDVRNNQSGRLGPGLDVRGTGGQILAAPTVHPNGTPYRWVVGAGPDDIEPAQAPKWLLDLLAEPPQAAPAPPLLPVAPRNTPAGTVSDPDPAEWYNAAHTWPELLTADGWALTRTRGDEHQWTRPGKSGRAGISATVGHGGRDCLKVFTSSAEGLTADEAYSRFGYYAATAHHGDRSAAARAIRAAMPPAARPDYSDPSAWLTATPAPAADGLEPAPAADPFAFAHVIDWQEFWTKDRSEQRWAVYPLVPAGRSVSVYAPAKAGKSAVILAALLAAATGKHAFAVPDLAVARLADPPPISVLYLDYEMTEEDVETRVTELGYGPADDLSRFHYALLPSLPPLDTPAGADAVLALAHHYAAELVVIDTFGRAVEGEENSADTVRAYYRHTGLALKAAGIAALRTDHTGKDADKGQRGSSAKVDDVDVVWSLRRSDVGSTLTRTHSRIGWVPETVELTRTDDGGQIRWTTAHKARTWLAGTQDVAAALDDIGAPVDLTRDEAANLLRAAGQPRRNNVVGDAVKWRKEQAADPSRMLGTDPGTDLSTTPGTGTGTGPENRGRALKPQVTGRDGGGDGRGRKKLPDGDGPSPVRGTARTGDEIEGQEHRPWPPEVDDEGWSIL